MGIRYRAGSESTASVTLPVSGSSGAGRLSFSGSSRRRQGRRNRSLAQLEATRSSHALACSSLAKTGPALIRRRNTSCMISSASVRLLVLA
jgi:hypothetical protein